MHVKKIEYNGAKKYYAVSIQHVEGDDSTEGSEIFALFYQEYEGERLPAMANALGEQFIIGSFHDDPIPDGFKIAEGNYTDQLLGTLQDILDNSLGIFPDLI